MNNIFFTGYPGFIGKRLIHELLQKNPDLKFTFLVHPAMEVQAREDFLNSNFDQNHEIVIGDITQPNLGMPAEKAKSVQEQTESVFHLAAIYDLTVKESTAEKVNIFGTENILDFFSKSPNLKRFNYISTCYVAGDREGLVQPDELEKHQKFHNFYESTKYAAEVLVKKRKEMPITIFRPAIVVGDSQTGETDKFDGPYVVIKFLHKIKFLLRLVPNLGFSHSEINTVPVDYLVRVISHLSFNEKTLGKTYQICDQSPPTSEDFFSEMVWMIGGMRPYHAPFLRAILLKILMLPGVSKITGISKQAFAYFSYKGQFRSPNLEKDLENSGIHFTNYKNVYPTLYKFMTKNI